MFFGIKKRYTTGEYGRKKEMTGYRDAQLHWESTRHCKGLEQKRRLEAAVEAAVDKVRRVKATRQESQIITLYMRLR